MKHLLTEQGILKLSKKVKRNMSLFVILLMCINLFGITSYAESDDSSDEFMAEVVNYINDDSLTWVDEEPEAVMDDGLSFAFEQVEISTGTDAISEDLSTNTDANYEEEEFYLDEDVEFELIEEGLVGASNNTVNQLSDTLNINISSDKVYPNDANNGIYFLKLISGGQYNLYFYSLSDKSVSKVDVDIKSKPFFGNNALYWCAYDFDYDASDGNNYTNHIYKFDLNTKKYTLLCNIITYTSISTFGVDSSENIYAPLIYVTLKSFRVFTKNGTLITSADFSGTIGEFYGFDSTTGNFYYKGSYNWRYWGYDHYMDSVCAGNFKNNTLNINEKPLMLLNQNYYSRIMDPVDFYAGRYLALRSAFLGGTYGVLDSNKFNYTDVSEVNTTINLSTGGTSVTSFAVNETSVIKCATTALKSDFSSSSYIDQNSIGSASAYTKKNNKEYMWVATDNYVITRYDLSNGKETGRLNTKYPVFKVMSVGNELVVMEKNNDTYYIESVNTDEPTSLTVSTSTSMKTGDTALMNVSTNSNLSDTYTYTSSDNKIVAVSKAGVVTAWKPGTATITVKSDTYNLTKQIKITVSKRSIGTFENYNRVNSANTTSNIHKINNTTYGAVIYSYITDMGNGKYMRTQYVGNKKLYVEYFNSVGTVSDKKEITIDGELFGGFYAGKDSYFVVSGNNGSDDANTNSYIITKYSKSWSKQSSLPLKDVYTTFPFDAGSCRMDELNGKLYVHTCHERPDGHQSNCTFVINESNMSLSDSYYETMNLSYGYVSHSFNQFIKNDGDYIYRLDHGDAYPRGIVVTKIGKDDKVTNVGSSYDIVVNIAGSTGANYTGHSVGGFELSDNNCIFTYNADISGSSSGRNVYVGICNKDFTDEKSVKLTNYAAGGDIITRPPILVNLKNNHFLVMWEEFSKSGYNYISTKAVTIDEDGNITSDTVSLNMPLSDCQPIYTDKGVVAWYVSDGSSESYYAIDPYNPSTVNNINSDGTVNMFRLYNPNSGEHFYTANVTEKNNLVSFGWRYEGIGWKAPVKSNTPVYRLYNKNAGDHHYTMSASERDFLVSVGWKYEGIGWYSDDSKSVPLYRQYNPNAKAGSHNYTTSKK
ncbi:MAG: Ig-like domain-containing protein, partial [Lachnospiraceae bacterium]|nr:Ig-like domain-containing protein [Lachnospiraceae bacterium]